MKKLQLTCVATDPVYHCGEIVADDVRSPFTNNIVLPAGEQITPAVLDAMMDECIDRVYLYQLLPR